MTAAQSGPEPLPASLHCADLGVEFVPRGRKTARSDRIVAVDGVSFDVVGGRTLAIVGESGCGKSTLARALAGVQEHTGQVTVSGAHVGGAGANEDALVRPVQMVFQDPYASLDPRRTIGFSVSEPLRAQRSLQREEIGHRVSELLELVGLAPEMATRYPHEFSGGQRQRIAIARALGADPAVLVCDEATSALDVSVQAQIVNLLLDAQLARGFAMVFVTHNLAVVRQIADEIAVMYLGRFVEYGTAADIFANPTHPYSQALLSAVPRTSGLPEDYSRVAVVGDPPDPRHRPTGCHFHPRCRLFDESGHPGVCRVRLPMLTPVIGSQDHRAACHIAAPELTALELTALERTTPELTPKEKE
jgi:oligopeptide transport system ATP-binding protein